MASSAASEEFKISVNSEWPPYSVNVGKGAVGILPSLMQEIIQSRMNITVSSIGSPWGRAQKLVETGKLDALVTVPTAGRLEYANRSKEIVYSFEMRAVVKSDSIAHQRLSAATDIETVRPLRVCDIAGNAWAERFYEKNNITFYAAPNVETCLRMIDRKRMDILIQPYAVTLSELRKAGLADRLTVLEKPFGGMEFALLVSKNSPFSQNFIADFDQAVREMKRDGSYDRLVSRLRGVK